MDNTIFFKLPHPTMSFISLSSLIIIFFFQRLQAALDDEEFGLATEEVMMLLLLLLKLCLPLLYLLLFLTMITCQPSAQDENIPTPGVDEAVPPSPSPLPQSFVTSDTEGTNCTPGVSEMYKKGLE